MFIILKHGTKSKTSSSCRYGEIKTLTLKVVGGESPSNAVLASRLSPFGCNPKKSGEEIAKSTKDYTNIRIYITLHIPAKEIKKLMFYQHVPIWLLKN